MTRSLARKLLLATAALCATTHLAPPADAGVAGKNFGVRISRSKETFDDCFTFATGNRFLSQVGLAGTWQEFDLFLFGFWSFRASNDITFTGTHVLGVWVIGGGTNTVGERFFASGFQGCFFAPPDPTDTPFGADLSPVDLSVHRAREFDPRTRRG